VRAVSDATDQRALLARVIAELIAVRRARLLSMLVLAAAMLVAGLGAAMQAQGEHIDAVLLFSAFSLIMIGIVCALGAIIAWTRLNRDVLDSVAAAPPARARAPRTRTAGMVVAIGFVVLGALFAVLPWDRTPILAAPACALGPVVAWPRLTRDVLASVAAAPPASASAPRPRTAGMVVAIGFVVLGALFAVLLWDRTPILAAAVIIACALLACLGPIWAGELASADDRLAVILDSDDELSERLATFTPIWLHEATEAEDTRRDRS